MGAKAKKEHTYENYVFGDSSSASNAMKMYLKEIEEYKMLSASEEIELAKDIDNSIPEAKEKFINANYRLVVSIAKKNTTTKKALSLVPMRLGG